MMALTSALADAEARRPLKRKTAPAYICIDLTDEN